MSLPGQPSSPIPSPSNLPVGTDGVQRGPGMLTVFQGATVLEVDKSDMVAIKAAAVEKQIRAELNAAEDTLMAISRDYKKAVEVRDKAISDFGGSEIQSKSDTLQHALIAFGIANVTYDTSSDFLEPRSPHPARVRTTVSFKQEGFSHGSGFTISRSFTNPAPDAVVAAVNTVNDLHEQSEDQKRTIVGLRARIANLSALERQARAGIARAVLEKSEEGRAILAELEAIDELPSPTPTKRVTTTTRVRTSDDSISITEEDDFDL